MDGGGWGEGGINGGREGNYTMLVILCMLLEFMGKSP